MNPKPRTTPTLIPTLADTFNPEESLLAVDDPVKFRLTVLGIADDDDGYGDGVAEVLVDCDKTGDVSIEDFDNLSGAGA